MERQFHRKHSKTPDILKEDAARVEALAGVAKAGRKGRSCRLLEETRCTWYGLREHVRTLRPMPHSRVMTGTSTREMEETTTVRRMEGT